MASTQALQAIIMSIAAGYMLFRADIVRASESQPGTVYEVIGEREGILIFNHTGQRSQRPACATTARWAIDMKQPGGPLIASIILTAQAQGRNIWVIGTGGCEDWGDTETVHWVTSER